MIISIFVLSFAAVFLSTLVLLGYEAPSRFRVKQTLRQIDIYVRRETSFPPRSSLPKINSVMILDVFDRLARYIGKFSLINSENLQDKLVKAGIRNIDANKFISIKLILVGVAALVDLLYLMTWLVRGGHLPWIGLLILIPVFFAPDLWLGQRVKKRQKQIRLSLPDSLDILTIALEAGSAFDSALVKVVKNMKGPLGEEFGRMLWELQIGISRHDAFHNLGERNDVPELKRICSLLIQADTLGISISKMLRTEVSEIRRKRKQTIEEAALKTPVKLVFPVILCIIPALLLIIVGPGLIRIAEMFTNL